MGNSTMAKTLHIYLHSPLRDNAKAGRVNIFNRIASALPGWKIVYHPDTDAEHLRATQRDHNLFHMAEPQGPNTLCLRRAYHYPFWRIETTNQRWNFDVARAHFDSAAISPVDANQFFSRWRTKVWGEGPTRRDGFVFVPLQGRLLEHRSFQSMSPLAMLETVLTRFPAMSVRASLHPRETYSPADLLALSALADRFGQFELTTRTAQDLIGCCDLIATQNSSVALTGYFAAKPAILFAGIDFHHIAGSVPRDGVDLAFARPFGPAPDHAAYLWWFFKAHAINGGAPEAESQIRARLVRHGWVL
jgi:hypothetical protein